MGFSRAQHGRYRPLVDKAWQLHAKRSGIDPSADFFRLDWYQRELKSATGKESTKDCNAGRDYDKALAHFEALAEDGINAQIALVQGITKRLRWHTKSINAQWLAHTFRSNSDFERYLRGIASQITGADFPELHTLSDSQIQTLTRSVCIAAKRALQSGQ